MSEIPLNAIHYYLLFDQCIIYNYVISETNMHYRMTKRFFLPSKRPPGSGPRPIASRKYTEGFFTEVKLAGT